MDQNRLDAMNKLEELNKGAIISRGTAESSVNEEVDGISPLSLGSHLPR
jgi:hypothetical protein